MTDIARRLSSRLWNRNFFFLWQGQAISQLGNQALTVALLYWTLKATGSASLMGLLLATSALPGVLLSPIGGAVADRFRRLRIVCASDLLSALGLLALTATMFATSAPRIVIPMLFGVSALLGSIRAFFNPALGAAIPDLVPTDRLEAANAANQFAWQAAMLVGQGLGGLFYTLFGAPLLLLGDAVSFLFSAGCTALIRTTPAAAGSAERSAGERTLAVRGGWHRFRSDIAGGLRYARSTSGFLAFLFGAAGFNFFLMPILVLLPIYVQKNLHSGPRWYGFVLGALGVGSLVGYVVAGMIRLAGRARGLSIQALVLLAPVPMVAIGFVSARPTALLLSFILGAMLAMVNVQFISILQATTPPELRGRVMSLVTLVANGLSPIGMALGGVIGDLTGKNVPLVYALCGLTAVLFELVLMPRRSVLAFLSCGGLSAPSLPAEYLPAP